MIFAISVGMEHSNLTHDAEALPSDADLGNSVKVSQRGRGKRRAGRIRLALFLALLMMGVGFSLWVIGTPYTPELMVDVLSGELEGRLGMPVHVQGLEVGSTSVTLNEVEIESPDGEVQIIVNRLQVFGDMIDLAKRRAGSIVGVRVEGVDVHVDLDHPAAVERIGALRQRLIEPDGSSGVDTDVSEGGPDGAASIDLPSLPELLSPALHLLRPGAEIQLVAADVGYTKNGERVEVLRHLEGRWVQVTSRDVELRGEARHLDGHLDGFFKVDLEDTGTYGEARWSELPVASLNLALSALELPPLPVIKVGGAKTSGYASWDWSDAHPLRVETQVELADFELEHPRLASQPLRHLSGVAWGAGLIDLQDRRVLIEELSLESEGAVVALTGELAWQEDGYLIDVVAELPSTSCDTAVGAIPAAMLGDYSGFGLSGDMQGILELHIDSTRVDDAILDVEIDERCTFHEVPENAELERFDGPFRHLVRGHDGDIVYEFETGPGAPTWTPIEYVSPFFLQAVLAHEDAGFFRHSGFATYAMEASLRRNLEEGKFVRGASTVSMQLAKNLFLSRDKTLSRKAQEVLLTWWLEKHLSKAEILELYVNVVELGPEIFGIGQAAQHYFGRHPIDLTPAESVFLATSLPAPVPRYEQYEEGTLQPAIAQEIRFLLRHMERKERLDAVAKEHGLAQLERFEFHYDETPRSIELGIGRPGELPFDTGFEERRNGLWQVSQERTRQPRRHAALTMTDAPD